jgi:periodic tryptophan protein 1
MQKREAEAEAAARAEQVASIQAAEAAGAPAPAAVEDTLGPEFDMDNYDDDEAGGDANDLSAVLGVHGMMMHGSNAEDPHIMIKDGADDVGDSDEEEDLALRPSDAIILAARAEEEYSCLEVHVYEEDTQSFYVHHDMALPAFPLCVEWLDCCGSAGATGAVGSYVAVGSFRPQIELWDLNTVGAVEPSLELGGRSQGKCIPGSHTDAVMGLSWNARQRNLMLSASADRTVKLWDVTEGRCALTMRHHTDKVSAVRWNPVESSVLASASFDRTAVVLDVRSPTAGLKLAMTGDAEELVWNPHNPALLLSATDSGAVCCHDVRMSSTNAPSGGKSAVWTLQAHGKSITSITLAPRVPGLMATSSVDKTVKVWDIAGEKPACVASKNMQIGSLFCAALNPESPFLLVCGGEDGRVALWDVEEQQAIAKRFGKRTLDEAPFGAGAAATASGAGAAAVAAPEGMLGAGVQKKQKKKKNNKKKGKKKRR